MSKVTTNSGDPQQRFDELRSQANTDYFDIMLLHVQQNATWPADSARWQDGILEAESRKIILSHGASVHGLPALRQVPANKWLQVAMIRMNHNGTRMDNEQNSYYDPGNVTEVVTHVKQARAAGLGIISMKLAGEGTFDHDDRQAAMRFAFRNAGRRYRYGRLQESRGSRRGDRQPESCAGLAAPTAFCCLAWSFPLAGDTILRTAQGARRQDSLQRQKSRPEGTAFLVSLQLLFCCRGVSPCPAVVFNRRSRRSSRWSRTRR